jgi:Na+-driven multidrug efflux pump
MTAAYAAAMQLFTYVQMPAMAIGGAVSAMAAQFIGAKKWDRLDHITRAGVMINFVMTGLLSLLLLVFDRALLVLFLGPDSAAVPLAQHIQWLAVWSFILFGVTMVFSATMRAGGAVWAPLMIIAIALYPVRLGFYCLTYDWLGAGRDLVVVHRRLDRRARARLVVLPLFGLAQARGRRDERGSAGADPGRRRAAGRMVPDV